MRAVSLLPQYLLWHYGRGIRDGVQIWENYLWFFYHLFSIPDLIKTLFAPWRRLGEHPAAHSGMQAALEALLVNTIMRLAGAMIRIMFIFFGVLVLVSMVVLGTFFFFIWCILPLVCLFLYMAGFNAFVHVV